MRLARIYQIGAALFWVALAVGVGLGCRQTSVASTATPRCPWSVKSDRDATAADSVLANRLSLLVSQEPSNRVPGPGGLVALVEIDSLFSPSIVIEDSATGTKRHLIRGSWPRWSPDGSLIACSIWKSKERPWELCIVDVRTGKRLEPELGCMASEMVWAPDGRALAVGGRLYGKPVSVLCWVSLPEGNSRMLDTLPVFAAYKEFAWSPDSRALVVTRVTATDGHEEPVASDLWILEENGLRCPLTATADVMETEPHWLDPSRVLFRREDGSASEAASRLRVLTIQRQPRREARGAP